MPTANNSNSVHPTLERMALAIGEHRLDLGLSLRQLEALAGVSRTTLTKIERGRRVDPRLLLQVASVLTTVELHTAEVTS